jgi:hypothetical protein
VQAGRSCLSPRPTGVRAHRSKIQCRPVARSRMQCRGDLRRASERAWMPLVWSPRCQALIFDNGIFLPLLVRPRRRVSAEPDTGRPGSRQFQFGDAPLHQYHRASGRSKTAIAASKDRSEIIEREGLNTNQTQLAPRSLALAHGWFARITRLYT